MNNYRRLFNTLTVANGYNILTNLNYTVYKVCTPRALKPTQRRSFFVGCKIKQILPRPTDAVDRLSAISAARRNKYTPIVAIHPCNK